MTLRENLKQQVQPFKAQEQSALKLLKVSGISFIVGYPVYLIWNVAGTLLNIPLICFLIGAMIKHFSTVSVGVKVKCPVCNKRLGFLFRDLKNFSWSPFSRIQEVDSGEITHCPSCLIGMDDEINSQNQNMDPIVTTPVDEVEAQSTQGHV